MQSIKIYAQFYQLIQYISSLLCCLMKYLKFACFSLCFCNILVFRQTFQVHVRGYIVYIEVKIYIQFIRQLKWECSDNTAQITSI